MRPISIEGDLITTTVVHGRTSIEHRQSGIGIDRPISNSVILKIKNFQLW
jgi:hypothetical protein